MEAKYYTPELEEFHVGFEFESDFWFFTEEGEWAKSKITEDTFEDFVSLYKNDAYATEFRVKYLDREDIESLGFTNYVPPMEYNHSWNYKGGKDPKIYVWFNCAIPEVRIFSSFPTILFQGPVKNKSELRKLMSQLQIKTL